jgi:multicomponent Na+:H+ antiporter subunit D
MIWLRLYPLRGDRTIVDADWLYRYVGDGAARWFAAMARIFIGWTEQVLGSIFKKLGRSLFNVFSPAGALSKEFPSGLMALWTAILLAGVLLVAYFSPV